MHVITVPGYEPEDYLHPDQRLEFVDEQTGQVYELYVRANAATPGSRSEISLFIPITAIQRVQSDQKYCVMTLSPAIDAREERVRRATLPAALHTPAAPRPKAAARPARHGKKRPARGRSSSQLKAKR